MMRCPGLGVCRAGPEDRVGKCVKVDRTVVFTDGRIEVRDYTISDTS
jgi:hypothetical protein